MKLCIWCSKKENFVTFNKIAHTIPQSLGGKNICKNVCDDCNEYFGRKEFGKPAVEIALKEVLNISKYLLLTQHKEIKLKDLSLSTLYLTTKIIEDSSSLK